MPFTLFRAKNLRNFDEISVSPNSRNNIFVGLNGAGKTNILEGIYINAVGRSFRNTPPAQTIKNNENRLTLFSKYQAKQESLQTTYKLGVEREKGKQQKIHINGKTVNNLSQLASLVPVIVIKPDEAELLDGPAINRRKYIDMSMFHVEPLFFDVWKQHQSILKQRNHLLKELSSKSRKSETINLLQPWNTQFIQTNIRLSQMREGVVRRLSEELTGYLSRFQAFDNYMQEGGIMVSFYQGWNNTQTLQLLLETNLDKEIERGFTLYGGHRADIKVKTKAGMGKDIFSRGQKKLLTMLMRLAQAKHLCEESDSPPVLLLDDVFAELDENSIKTFIELVESLELQTFFTCVQKDQIQTAVFKAPTTVFHVEHNSVMQR